MEEFPVGESCVTLHRIGIYILVVLHIKYVLGIFSAFCYYLATNTFIGTAFSSMSICAYILVRVQCSTLTSYMRMYVILSINFSWKAIRFIY